MSWCSFPCWRADEHECEAGDGALDLPEHQWQINPVPRSQAAPEPRADLAASLADRPYDRLADDALQSIGIGLDVLSPAAHDVPVNGG